MLAEGELATFVPEGVVAREHTDFVVVDVDDVGADVVEEVSVVRDDDDGIGEVGEVFFEPEDCVEVEVVGGFVEEEVIGVAEEGLCEEYLDFLLTGEVFHQLVMKFFFDAETAEEVGGVAFGIPSVHFGKFFFELAEEDSVFVVKVGFGIEFVFLLHVVPQLFVSDKNGVEDRIFVESEVVLDEDRQTFAGSHFDASFGGVEFAREYFEESGLASTIGTNDTIAVAGCKLKVDVFEEWFFVELNGEVCNCNHL